MTEQEIKTIIVACVDRVNEREVYPKDIMNEVYQYIEKWYNETGSPFNRTNATLTRLRS